MYISVSSNFLCWEPNWPDINIVTPAFLLMFAFMSLMSFIFSLPISLKLKRVSSKRYTLGLCFIIRSANPFLLFGEFKSFILL